MRVLHTHSDTISAAHYDPLCSKHIHGHSWHIEVVSSVDLRPIVRGLMMELNMRHLNDMIGANEVSPELVARFLWERLSLHGPLNKIIVSTENHRVSYSID